MLVVFTLQPAQFAGESMYKKQVDSYTINCPILPCQTLLGIPAQVDPSFLESRALPAPPHILYVGAMLLAPTHTFSCTLSPTVWSHP